MYQLKKNTFTPNIMETLEKLESKNNNNNNNNTLNKELDETEIDFLAINSSTTTILPTFDKTNNKKVHYHLNPTDDDEETKIKIKMKAKAKAKNKDKDKKNENKKNEKFKD